MVFENVTLQKHRHTHTCKACGLWAEIDFSNLKSCYDPAVAASTTVTYEASRKYVKSQDI